MELKLDRKFKKETYTIGKLYVNGVLFCDTVEDRDRGLTQSMSEAEIKKIKVYGQTAIPTGTYDIVPCVAFTKKAWSKKYNCKMPLIKGTKGFVGCYLHPANDASQILGCVAVGENKVKGKVLNSTATFYKLMDNYIIPAWTRNENVKLIIY